MGKKKFRNYVELFLDPIFRAANNKDNQNMAISAQDLTLELEKTYGQSIFKAILEGHDERYVKDLERFRQESIKPKDFDYSVPPGAKPAGAMGMGMGSG